MGVRYHKEDGENPEELRDDFVHRISELLTRAADSVDGLFIIIDEADRPDSTAQLGEFLKLFTERLTKRNCFNVLLGLAGLPSNIAKLRESHESSPRLLEILRLEPLSPDERKQVVSTGLQEAKRKNGFETKITQAALIAELSEGYPHFIQQFSYCAFAEDDDNVIDVDDVKREADKENGALMQLGNKYFSEIYHAEDHTWNDKCLRR